jgi:hypothetical protein
VLDLAFLICVKSPHRTRSMPVVRAICPSPFISSTALRRRKKQTRNMATVAASLGPAGMKPTEAKKSSMGAG